MPERRKKATAKKRAARRSRTRPARAKQAARATSKTRPTRAQQAARATSKTRPTRAKSARPRAAGRPAARARRAPRAGPPNAIGLEIHHTDFTSHDMDGVRRFYTEMLGFTSFQLDTRFNYLNI